MGERITFKNDPELKNRLPNGKRRWPRRKTNQEPNLSKGLPPVLPRLPGLEDLPMDAADRGQLAAEQRLEEEKKK